MFDTFRFEKRYKRYITNFMSYKILKSRVNLYRSNLNNFKIISCKVNLNTSKIKVINTIAQAIIPIEITFLKQTVILLIFSLYRENE